MTSKRFFQSATSHAQKSHGHRHRAYTVAEIRERIPMSKATFFRLRRLGQLPFLEEIKPRLGRLVRYRADLVDRFLANDWRAVKGV